MTALRAPRRLWQMRGVGVLEKVVSPQLREHHRRKPSCNVSGLLWALFVLSGCILVGCQGSSSGSRSLHPQELDGRQLKLDKSSEPAWEKPLATEQGFIQQESTEGSQSSASAPRSSLSAKMLCEHTLSMAEAGMRNHYGYVSSEAWSESFLQRLMVGWFEALDPKQWIFTAGDVTEFAEQHEKMLQQRLQAADCSIMEELAAGAAQRLEEARDGVSRAMQQGIRNNWQQQPAAAALLSDFALRVQREVLAEGRRVQEQYPEKSSHRIAALWRRHYAESPLFASQLDELTWVHEGFLQAFFHSLDGVSSYAQPSSFVWKVPAAWLGEAALGAWSLQPSWLEVPRWAGGLCEQGGLCTGDRIVAAGLRSQGMMGIAQYGSRQLLPWLRSHPDGAAENQLRLGVLRAQDDGGFSQRYHEVLWRSAAVDTQKAKPQVQLYRWDDLSRELGRTVAVLEIPRLQEVQGKSVAEQVAWLAYELRRQEAVDAWVLDLRHTESMGSVQQALELLHLFFTPPTPPGYLKGAYGWHALELLKPAPPVVQEPLVVLVGEETRGLAEWLAGAVQLYGRGLVVGTQRRTVGEGWLWHVGHTGDVFAAPSSSHRMPQGAIYGGSGESLSCGGVKVDVLLSASASEDPRSSAAGFCLALEPYAEATEHAPTDLRRLSAEDIQLLRSQRRRRSSADALQQATQVALDYGDVLRGERPGRYQRILQDAAVPSPSSEHGAVAELSSYEQSLEQAAGLLYRVSLEEELIKGEEGVESYVYTVQVCELEEEGACTIGLRTADGGVFRIPGAWLDEYSYAEARSDQKAMTAQYLTHAEERRLFWKSFGRGLIGGGISGGITVGAGVTSGIVGATVLDATLDATAGVPGEVDENVGIPKAAGITSTGALMGTSVSLATLLGVSKFGKRFAPRLPQLRYVVAALVILAGMKVAFFSDSEKVVQQPLHPLTWVSTLVWGKSTKGLAQSWSNWTKDAATLILEEREVYAALAVFENFLHHQGNLPLEAIQSYCLPQERCRDSLWKISFPFHGSHSESLAKR